MSIEKEMALIGFIALLMVVSFLIAKRREKKYAQRKREIGEFDKHCELLVRTKPTYPWPMVLQLTEQQYIDKEVQKYRRQRPGFQTLLKSNRPLTIEHWYTADQQRQLFGISLPQPPTRKTKFNPKKVNNE